MKIENMAYLSLCTNLPSLTLNLEILLQLMMNMKQNEIKNYLTLERRFQFDNHQPHTYRFKLKEEIRNSHKVVIR